MRSEAENGGEILMKTEYFVKTAGPNQKMRKKYGPDGIFKQTCLLGNATCRQVAV